MSPVVLVLIVLVALASVVLGLFLRARRASALASAAYRELLRHALGDHEKVERLIAFERARDLAASRERLIRRAIDRWRQDNR